MTNDLRIYGENIFAFPHILGSPSLHMTLHPIPSEFPDIWGKFCFLFYQCKRADFHRRLSSLAFCFKIMDTRTYRYFYIFAQTMYLPPSIFNIFNPHQNDQGRKGPCCFQRLIALKCQKCQKIKKKYLFRVFEVYFLVNPISCSYNKLFSMILII